MKLQGELIQNNVNFKTHFNFEEFWKKKNDFVNDCADFFKGREGSWFRIIKFYVNEEPLSHKEEAQNLLTYGKLSGLFNEELIDELKTQISGFEQTSEVLLCIQAIYLLAGRKITSEEIDKIVSSMEVNLKLYISQRGDYKLKSGTYEVEHYAFDLEGDFDILTVRLFNTSTSGIATINVVYRNTTLQSRDIEAGSFVYAHFIGKKLLRFLPSVSVCDTHCVFIRKEGEKFCISRFIFKDKKDKDDKVMDFKCNNVDEISCIVAVSNGFVGIQANKNIIFCSEKDFYPMASINFRDGEVPVWLAVKGNAYVVLTNRGTTYSNYPFERNGLVSVFISQDYNIYGLTAQGKIVSAEGDMLNTEGQAVAFSIYEKDKFIYRKLNGELCVIGFGRKLSTYVNVNEAGIANRNIYILEKGKLKYIPIKDQPKYIDLTSSVTEFDCSTNHIVYKTGNNWMHCLDMHLDTTSEVVMSINLKK